MQDNKELTSEEGGERGINADVLVLCEKAWEEQTPCSSLEREFSIQMAEWTVVRDSDIGRGRI